MQAIFQAISNNNQQELIDYLKQIKIQSQQQRQDFQQSVNVFLQLENNKFLYYLELIKASNEVNTRNILSEIFTKSFFSFNEFHDKELLIQNWKIIPIDYIEEFFKKFNINIDEIQDPQPRILQLLQNKKPQQALKLIGIFQKKCDLSLFIDKFISLDCLNEFAVFCKNQEELIKQFISKLQYSDKRNQQKLATELIKQYNLNKDDFPKLIENQNKQAVERTYFPKIAEPYERAEERLQGYPFMLRHVIQKLIDHNMKDQAYSVAVRAGLNDEFQLQGKYLENCLFIKDGFGITEEICFNQDCQNYIKFKDFNLDEQNIHFIDTIKKVQQASKIILQSPISGFDTEFCHYFDEFTFGGVAILQIAIETDVFIFDIFNLKEEQDLLNFLNEYFKSNQIKIGHSVRNDFNEMTLNMKLDKSIEPVNIIDISIFYNEVIKTSQNSVSLANQTYQLFGKQLSKNECFSNWQRRPLRKCQLYYSAMDAFICIAIYKKLNDIQLNNTSQQFQQLKLQQNKLPKQYAVQIVKIGNLRYDQKYEEFINKKDNLKFLVDSMLKKLSTFLRNLGFDTEYNEKNDHISLEQQAIQQQRIIVTRDKKLFEKPTLLAPCFLLNDSSNTEQQFEQLKDELKMIINEHMLLSRCVKCNFDHVVLISPQEAEKFINFKHTDSPIQEYWQCKKCFQVYWEGNQFKNSIQRFTKVVNNQHQ